MPSLENSGVSTDTFDSQFAEVENEEVDIQKMTYLLSRVDKEKITESIGESF